MEPDSAEEQQELLSDQDLVSLAARARRRAVNALVINHRALLVPELCPSGLRSTAGKHLSGGWGNITQAMGDGEERCPN